MAMPLNEYGFDPITMTEFVSKLNKEFNLELNTSLFIEHLTLFSFTEYLVDEYKDQFVKRFPQAIPTVSRKGDSKIHRLTSEVSMKMKEA